MCEIELIDYSKVLVLFSLVHLERLGVQLMIIFYLVILLRYLFLILVVRQLGQNLMMVLCLVCLLCFILFCLKFKLILMMEVQSLNLLELFLIRIEILM